jgi:hypothetical protein
MIIKKGEVEVSFNYFNVYLKLDFKNIYIHN